MAVVYLARERASGRSVAIKVLGMLHAGHADAARRFAREAHTVARFDHPNIVRTLAIEELGGNTVAIVTEYVPGRTLRATLRESGALSFERAAAILRDVAAALAYAHGLRIVHRDVKPENIFVHASTGRALLADFGIARPIEGDTLLTAAGASLGTPSYMAPEQVLGGAVDERTDVYALGLVGWETLTGRRPWEGETLYAVLHNQQHERLPSLAQLRPDIPAYLLAAIDGAIAKAPSDRWPNGAAFLDRLTPVPVALPPRPVRAAASEDAVPTVRFDRPMPRPVHAEPLRPVPTRVEPIPEAPLPEAPLPEAPLREAPPRDHGIRPAAIRVEPIREEVTSAPSAPSDPLRASWSAARPSLDASRRRWWPLAGIVAAAVLLVVVLTATRGRGTARAGTALDSLVDVVSSQSGDVVLRDSTGALVPGSSTHLPADSAPRTAPQAAPQTAPRSRATAATPKRAPTSSGVCASPAAADQRACLLAAVDRHDAALTRDYQALIAALRRQAGGAREPASVRALRADQRAWIDRRDRTCRARAPATESTLWGAARAPCFAEQSDARAAQLRARASAIGRR